MNLPSFFNRSRQRGQSSVEVLMAMAILAIVSQAVVLIVRTASKQNVANRDRMFAMEKAVQMLEELRSVVMDESAQITVLDAASYNDGRYTATDVLPPGKQVGDPKLKYTLTTRLDITQPGGVPNPDYQTGNVPLSGNPQRGKGYVYVRNVEIVNSTTASGTIIDPNLRKIWVRIWAASSNPGSAANSTPAAQALGLPLAQVYGMVHSLGAANQPGQVLDMYLLALESVPGWWSRTSNLIPLFNSALVSLQARNPGLYIRPHWINRMSIGRDFEYTPEYNGAVLATTSGAYKKAYVYPGLITYDDGADYYYLQSQFSGRINVDGTILNNNQPSAGGAPFNSNLGYPIADQWNHAARLGDEERIYAALCTIADNNGMAHPQLSWRQILERMNNPNNPDFANYINSILVNLHGEMVPALPLRNYSDAAKDPDYYWNTLRYDGLGNSLAARQMRAVSQTDRLAYASTNDGSGVPTSATVNVYAYDANPVADPITPYIENDLINDVTVFVPNAQLSNLGRMWRMKGNSKNSYAWISQTAANWVPGTDSDGNPCYMDGITPSTSTWVADYYTPPGRSPGLRIHLQGVTPTARLYYGPPN